MKKLFYLFALVYMLVYHWFHVKKDNAIKLIINIVHDGRRSEDAKGDLYFTDELSDGLRIRVFFWL